MKTWLAAFFLLTTQVWGSDQPAKSPQPGAANQPRQLADVAMRFVASDDMKGLFNYFGEIMPMDAAELKKIRDSVLSQRKALGDSLGTPAGIAFINECRKSDILVRLLYAEKRTKSAMRWLFIFYKARDRWTLAYFYWDDKVADFFVPC